VPGFGVDLGTGAKTRQPALAEDLWVLLAPDDRLQQDSDVLHDANSDAGAGDSFTHHLGPGPWPDIALRRRDPGAPGEVGTRPVEGAQQRRADQHDERGIGERPKGVIPKRGHQIEARIVPE